MAGAEKSGMDLSRRFPGGGIFQAVPSVAMKALPLHGIEE
jgi:hypothetical protein